jgi:NAD/NADP transhydrogenase beta subunit
MSMDFVSMNLVTLMYLVASVCFIQALKGLSHPTTSIRGNVFGMTGMTIAVITTAALIVKLSGSGMGMTWVLLGLVVGGGAGTVAQESYSQTQTRQADGLGNPHSVDAHGGGGRAPPFRRREKGRK